MFIEISTNELATSLENKDVKIIDVRPIDVYNGWPLENETRGGHIKNAKSLPRKWCNYLDWIDIVQFKNIEVSSPIILYGYDSEDIRIVAERFIKSGYNQVKIYLNFLTEWVPDISLPMEHLKRYHQLVPVSWVKAHLHEDNIVLIHAHYRNRDAYLSGHIPGAVDMDTLSLESPDNWNIRSSQELEQALLEHGITAETTVILYGKYMNPDNNYDFPGSYAGDIGAIRLAFIMMYAGVKDVKVLNGGFQSWLDEGCDISYNDEPKIPASTFGADIPQKPYLVVDTPKAKEMLASSNAGLVCVRSWPEYIGEVSGYNYIEAKGRIPGAIFADCGSDAYHMENYRNLDQTIREYHEVARIWRNNGITPDKHLAFYCGTGWRGSEAWFNAWLMGWENISVYDGGWFEWSADSNNPFETGIPLTLIEGETNNDGTRKYYKRTN